MKLVFDPRTSKTNKYVEIIAGLLSQNGTEVFSLNEFYAHLKTQSSFALLHLNWYENLNGNSFPKIFSSFIKKSIKLFTLKVFGKKIVWTMHNKMPHDQNGVFLKKIMMYYMLYLSDLIIVHSHVTKTLLLEYNTRFERKIRYIPHPNYIGMYGPSSPIPEKEGAQPLKLLFIGAVRPYKNIELLIEVAKSFSQEVELTIAGKPESEAYKGKLVALCTSSPHIKLDLHFIPDEHIGRYISNSDALILPYDLTSSLNSGTVLLAFSYSRTVICPEIGTISDLPDKSAILTYSYNSPQIHVEALSGAVKKGIAIKKAEPGAFAKMGNEMFDYISRFHDNETIVNSLLTEYRQLIG